MRLKWVIAGLLTSIFYPACGQNAEEKLFTVKDTLVTGIDTIDILNTTIKVRKMFKTKFNFLAVEGDSLLYSLRKEKQRKKPRKMKYWIVSPEAEIGPRQLNRNVINQYLTKNSMEGVYGFYFKRKGKKSNVNIDIKKLKGWSRIEKVTKEIIIPKPDSTEVIIYDTVPRVVIEGTHYLAAKRNIKSSYKEIVDFRFVPDSTPCYWTYLVGFGKNFEDKVANLMDLKTQQPLGDPLVAYFSRQYRQFPYSESPQLQLYLKGPYVNKRLRKTDFGTLRGVSGTYRLSITNLHQAVGEYIYFKVVAFDMVQKEVIKVPDSELSNIKTAQCPGI